MSGANKTGGPSTETTERGGVSDLGFVLLVSCESGVRVVPLRSPRSYVIGRVPECDIVIDDGSVSRQHARLSIGEDMALEDLGSTNGTTVQNRTVARGESAAVWVGSVFELGSATFVLQRQASGPGGHDPLKATKRKASPSSRQGPASGDQVVVDPTMRNLYALLDVVAKAPLSILILGETGVGKEGYAEAVHQRSTRSRGSLVKLNCTAIPESILEGELFGYERGAFTGAVQAKAGLFESGDGGTVFLDEIGEVPLSIQVKLLRVLETGQVQRLGSVKPRIVDVRFVSATNRDLRQAIAQGHFRSDLYFRLNGMTITIPPLRARRADIAPLARHFIERSAARLKKPEMMLGEGAVSALEQYDWPGNVRELRNLIERVVVLCPGSRIDAEHLVAADPEAFGARRPGPEPAMVAVGDGTTRTLGGLRGEVRALEKDRILEALTKCAGNQSQAARLLGMSRYTLINRIEEYGLARPRKR